MQPFQQEHGNQGCPNLDVQRVLAGTDEALDFQVLLEGLEEQFDFPAVFVDVGDGGGAEVEVISQEHDLALVFGIPRHDTAQQFRIIGLSFDTGETDELVGTDFAVLRDLAFFFGAWQE